MAHSIDICCSEQTLAAHLKKRMWELYQSLFGGICELVNDAHIVNGSSMKAETRHAFASLSSCNLRDTVIL